MPAYVLDLAAPADDAALRRLLRDNPVPGAVTLSYEREPNYFLGTTIMGDCQTLVAREESTGDVVGVATRALRPLWVNGRAETVGYIGGLRVDASHRGRWVVGQGFRFFHELSQDGRARGHITTIIEGNREAEGVLVTRARRHFPAYREVARLCTLALIPHWLARPNRLRDLEIRRGNAVALDDLVAFWHEQGVRKQFAPVWQHADFDGPTTRDFGLGDLLVACRRGKIVGTLGLWDQSRFKQNVVRGYGGNLQRWRALYNAALRLAGAQPLADVGQPLRFAYASFVHLADDDGSVFHVLLSHALANARQQNQAFLMLGLDERDPLYASARRRWHVPYFSRLYTVCWPGEKEFHKRLDGRVAGIEISVI